jgi:hypothetical protein
MEDLYINNNIDNYDFIDKYNFYYQLNDKIYIRSWNRPSYKKLNMLIDYFKNHFPNQSLFNIYLTGRFNSNKKNDTWDIDLIICYKDINYKNYSDIYGCLFFLKDKGLEIFYLLVDVSYCDNIYILKNDIPDNILTDDISKIEEYIRQRRLNEGEIILIYKNITKKSINQSFSHVLNHKIYNEINIDDKKLYIIDYNKVSLKKFIEKKKKYIESGCQYYDIKLLL